MPGGIDRVATCTNGYKIMGRESHGKAHEGSSHFHAVLGSEIGICLCRQREINSYGDFKKSPFQVGREGER